MHVLRIFLSLVLLLPLGLKTGVVLNWAIHQDYIAKNLCVNRDKPELHCNGKCVLMQKMRIADENDTPKPLPEVARLQIPAFIVSKGIQIEEGSQYFTNTDKPLFSDQTPENLLHFDIFHPPRA